MLSEIIELIIDVEVLKKNFSLNNSDFMFLVMATYTVIIKEMRNRWITMESMK